MAYQNLQCIFVVAIFFILGRLLIECLNASFLERRAYTLTFSVCLFWASISALYLMVFNDDFQRNNDAAHFFEFASAGAEIPLSQMPFLTDGFGAVYLWRCFYDFFSYLGFQKEPYIGVLVNIVCVSITAVITLKIAKKIFGEDNARLNQLIIMLACCGYFWFFAAIHMRDCYVLLLVTMFFYWWVSYLTKPSFSRLLMLIGLSLIGSYIFLTLRDEFFYIPLGMALAAVSATRLASNKSRKAYLLYFVSLIAILLLSIWFSDLLSEILKLIKVGGNSYTQLGLSESDEHSIGSQLILKQPPWIKVILGSGYLFLFPIPFWSGFQLETAYSLLKSLNVIFMYFLIPLIALAAIRLRQDRRLRTVPVVFLIFMVAEFTFVTACSSLETRHFGVCIVALLLLGLIPDLRNPSERKKYKIFLLYTFL
ncbi:MAG: hypothetical protein WCN27_05855, partial [Alphaproteobacteria bacterium]